MQRPPRSAPEPARLAFNPVPVLPVLIVAPPKLRPGSPADGVIIIWRFTGTRTLSETAEARARKAVAVTFFLLAPYIAYDAVTTLAGRHHARTSWLGIALAIASLIVMPALGVAKRRLGARLDSEATAGEGTQNLLCAYLAAAVLAGLLANTLLGWWWLDPAVALGIAALAVREGTEAWHGEECAC
jgi:Cation efflux family